MSRLPVSEYFLSIQGEGPHAGTPAVFCRVSGCNLSCGWDRPLKEYKPGYPPDAEGATWVCDSIASWRTPEFTVTSSELVDQWEEEGWLDKLRQGAHLILTGGEPLLPAHQERFQDLHRTFLERDVNPYVEVETNGTQDPEHIDRFVDWYNVSLKLENSGMPESRRIDRDAIRAFVSRGSQKAMFKFVASGWDDIAEIEELMFDHHIPNDQISLMPAGQTREHLEQTYPVVAEICKEKGWRFSPRLHITTWNLATGV